MTRDVINRSNNVLFQTMVILTNIALPVFGLVLYMIIRPTKTLTEKYYEELEYNFLNEHEHEESCGRCEKKVKSDFLFCPHCEEKLKEVCWSCKHTYLDEYAVCPYCGKKEKSATRKPQAEQKKKQSKKTKK
ncbi:MAG: zinc ribbon domain-containing protein [Candidatus Gracilibacteria bacterium]|nr:zinc ribbon domain-containing protein [Candidatus Gracilibacteria bacterium]